MKRHLWWPSVKKQSLHERINENILSILKYNYLQTSLGLGGRMVISIKSMLTKLKQTDGGWWTYDRSQNSRTAQPNNLKFGMNVEKIDNKNLNSWHFFLLDIFARGKVLFRWSCIVLFICFKQPTLGSHFTKDMPGTTATFNINTWGSNLNREKVLISHPNLVNLRYLI